MTPVVTIVIQVVTMPIHAITIPIYLVTMPIQVVTMAILAVTMRRSRWSRWRVARTLAAVVSAALGVGSPAHAGMDPAWSSGRW